MTLACVLSSHLVARSAFGEETWPPGQACVTRMTVPNGFEVKLFAAEPDVVNPIAIDFDHRGRMYVLEALQYPVKAPDGQTGLDRIRILEDTDGDHAADRVTLFAEGLNLSSGLAVGHGGVFVGQPPYLLFLEDTDADDRADRTTVLLDGWAYGDTHATLNSFLFGPDGWLYGNQGIGHESTVRGHRLTAGFWRYHPQSKHFEIFAEGTSNTWGLDYDENGTMFASVSVIPHLYRIVPHGFHRHPRGYLWSNPYAYGEIDTIVDHRHFPPPAYEGDRNATSFGGGHAHTGCLIYQGGAYPREYHGRVLLNNLHGNRINSEILERHGSSFVAHHGPDFFSANDSRFHGIQLRIGPDGSVFVLDWYDEQICHNSEPAVWDRHYGRIYKIVYQESPPQVVGDLAQRSTTELVELLRHENSWWWRRALLMLDERGDQRVVEQLKHMVRRSQDSRHSLRALWALHVLDLLDESFALELLSHESAWVRSWAVRLLGERPRDRLNPQIWNQLLRLAQDDSSPEVVLQMACSCVRWGAGDETQKVLRALVQRDEFAADPAIPAMIWVAWEPSVMSAPQEPVAWLLNEVIDRPMVRNPILPWTMRRLAESGSTDNLAIAGAILVRLDQPHCLIASLDGLLEGLKGRRLDPPSAWNAVRSSLITSSDAEIRQRVLRVGVHFGDPWAVVAFEEQAQDQKLSDEQRLEAIAALAMARRPSSIHVLIALSIGTDDLAIRGKALAALADFDNEEIAFHLLANWSKLRSPLQRQAIQALTSRPQWTTAALDAMERGVVKRELLSEVDARRILQFQSEDLNRRLEQVWGKLRQETPESISQSLTTLRQRLLEVPGDRLAGSTVFEKCCLICHRLYKQGHDVGPDLTGANRRNPEYLLTNIVDPNRTVERAYFTAIVADTTGRVHTGLLVQQTPERIVLKGENAQLVILDQSDVEQVRMSEKSLMPEDVLQKMTERQFSDLVAFLMEDLHLSRGWISRRFEHDRPFDVRFAVETTSRPLEVSDADWRLFQIGPAGRIEIERPSSDRYHRPQEGCTYIYCEVVAPRSLRTEMVVGFQRALKLWVNDQPIYYGPSPASQVQIPVELHPGPNRFLFKVSNITRNISGPAAAGPSWLQARLTDPKCELELAGACPTGF